MASSEDLRELTKDLLQSLEQKVEGRQGGVPTFHDNYLHRFLTRFLRSGSQAGPRAAESQGDGAAQAAGLARVRELLSRRDQGRFVEHRVRQDRKSEPGPQGGDIDPWALLVSQGAWDCLQWRGLPLFKTVYDFAIVPMLIWELRPATIIEVGSGSGASALWMADLLQVFDIEGSVVSLDIKPPEASHPKVRFVGGDCDRIAEALPVMELLGLGHPWLVVEDAHVNVLGVLRHLHQQMRSGDYLIVEDSAIKGEALVRFLAETRDAYRLDTHYADFFGRNATAARDSIFRRA